MLLFLFPHWSNATRLTLLHFLIFQILFYLLTSFNFTHFIIIFIWRLQTIFMSTTFPWNVISRLYFLCLSSFIFEFFFMILLCQISLSLDMFMSFRTGLFLLLTLFFEKRIFIFLQWNLFLFLMIFQFLFIVFIFFFFQ